MIKSCYSPNTYTGISMIIKHRQKFKKKYDSMYDKHKITHVHTVLPLCKQSIAVSKLVKYVCLRTSMYYRHSLYKFKYWNINHYKLHSFFLKNLRNATKNAPPTNQTPYTICVFHIAIYVFL